MVSSNRFITGIAALVAPAIGLIATGSASGASATFDIYNNNSTGAEFGLNISQGSGNTVDFTFINQGGSSSGFVNAIQTVDFESGFSSLISANNVDFSYSNGSMSFISAMTKNPYDAHKLDWQGTFFRGQATSASDAPVNVGDYVTMSFDLLAGVSFEDLMNKLGNAGYQIATHTKGSNVAMVIGEVFYDNANPRGDDIVIPVHAPTPSAVGAGLVLLTGMVMRRRRLAA